MIIHLQSCNIFSKRLKKIHPEKFIATTIFSSEIFSVSDFADVPLSQDFYC